MFGAVEDFTGNGAEKAVAVAEKTVGLEDRRAIAYTGGRLPSECPECRGSLATGHGPFLMRGPGGGAAIVGAKGKFCAECSALILDYDFLQEAAWVGLPEEDAVYLLGLVDLDGLSEAAIEVTAGGMDGSFSVIPFESFERRQGTSLDLTVNRISRNGRCRCGSGRKSKRCCGRAKRAS